MLHVAVPDALVGVAEVAPHPRDVAGEGAEPGAHEELGATANHLVDHAEVVRIHVLQIRQLREIVQIPHRGEIILESLEESLISLVTRNINQLILRNKLLDVVQDLLRGNFHDFVLELASAATT